MNNSAWHPQFHKEAYEKMRQETDASPMPTPPTRDPDVVTQLITQEKLIAELMEWTIKLDERLAPVLRQTAHPTEVAEPREELVPLAERLRAHNEMIKQAANSISSIIHRLGI